jgi:hypothetical protein
MGADSVGVLGFGKEHHGRDVLYFQMKVDLGSWHSTGELVPLTLTAKTLAHTPRCLRTDRLREATAITCGSPLAPLPHGLRQACVLGV